MVFQPSARRLQVPPICRLNLSHLLITRKQPEYTRPCTRVDLGFRRNDINIKAVVVLIHERRLALPR